MRRIVIPIVYDVPATFVHSITQITVDDVFPMPLRSWSGKRERQRRREEGTQAFTFEIHFDRYSSNWILLLVCSYFNGNRKNFPRFGTRYVPSMANTVARTNACTTNERTNCRTNFARVVWFIVPRVQPLRFVRVHVIFCIKVGGIIQCRRVNDSTLFSIRRVPRSDSVKVTAKNVSFAYPLLVVLLITRDREKFLIPPLLFMCRCVFMIQRVFFTDTGLRCVCYAF